VLRRLILIVFAVATVLVAAIFTSLNPGTLTLDLAFTEVSVRIALAFVIALAAGWLLGWLSTAGYIFELLRERRRLRAAVKVAEQQADALRAAPPPPPPPAPSPSALPPSDSTLPGV
jgi:uncharacterized membrane protein YciS (DUF1049 family)